MRGLIHEHGLVSALNRGSFYGWRNANGRLQGVALIGHATLIETRSEIAIQAFGHEARKHVGIHMILGERRAVDLFWKSFAENGQHARRRCGELLFERQLPFDDFGSSGPLRLATLEDLDRVLPIQAQMASSESGVNPMDVDPVGFRKRCARRIEMGRVWVCVQGPTLTFKCDIMYETPDFVYLEGIYVDPELRGKDHGLKCLGQVCKNLSSRTRSLCLFVNEQSQEAQRFYRRAGFVLRSAYSTIFPEPRADEPELMI
jgi:ribosomal protein S18 acetylase RimI-like enzyme